MKAYLTILFLSLTAIVSASDFSDARLETYVNGERLSHSLMLQPNQVVNLEFLFIDPRTDEVYKDFKIMHGKIMHLLIMNHDLSTFNHVHPYFDPITGRFSITLNTPYSDPDNYMTTNVLSKPGHYMIMPDVIIRGVGMRMFHRNLHVHGQMQMSPLIVDEEQESNFYEKSFYNNQFLGSLTLETIQGCGGELLNLYFHLRRLDESGNYIEIDNYGKWLDAGAHSVIVSKKMMINGMMSMAHTHSDLPYPTDENDGKRELENSFIFSFYNNGVLNYGPQKIWIQVKIDNKVHTFPFVFDYREEESTGNCH